MITVKIKTESWVESMQNHTRGRFWSLSNKCDWRGGITLSQRGPKSCDSAITPEKFQWRNTWGYYVGLCGFLLSVIFIAMNPSTQHKGHLPDGGSSTDHQVRTPHGNWECLPFWDPTPLKLLCGPLFLMQGGRGCDLATAHSRLYGCICWELYSGKNSKVFMRKAAEGMTANSYIKWGLLPPPLLKQEEDQRRFGGGGPSPKQACD